MRNLRVIVAMTSSLALALPASAVAAKTAYFGFNTTTTTTAQAYPSGTLTLHDGANTHTSQRVHCSAEQPPCHSLALDGADDYTEGRASSFQSSADGKFSVSVWAKSNNWGFSWQPLVFMDDDTYGTYSWALYGTTADSGTVHAYVRIRDGATLQTLDLYDTPRNTLSDGTWHNLALVVDGNEAQLYFDQALADDQTSSLAAGTVDVAADHLFVGGDTYYDSEKFGGFIDELKLYDEPLDAAGVVHEAGTF